MTVQNFGHLCLGALYICLNLLLPCLEDDGTNTSAVMIDPCLENIVKVHRSYLFLYQD